MVVRRQQAACQRPPQLGLATGHSQALQRVRLHSWIVPTVAKGAYQGARPAANASVHAPYGSTAGFSLHAGPTERLMQLAPLVRSGPMAV